MAEHERIIEAIIAREEKKARNAMRSHLQAVRRNLIPSTPSDRLAGSGLSRNHYSAGAAYAPLSRLSKWLGKTTHFLLAAELLF